MKVVILFLAVLALNAQLLARGVLCLTFDDRGLDGWTNAIPLFAQYGAHASFFVCGEIRTNELVRMKALSDAGHAVGLHTVGHRDVPRAFDEEGASTFIRVQIEPQRRAMREFGLPVRHLAYPNNRHTEETDAVLAGSGFVRFRASAKLVRDGISYYAPSNRFQLIEFDNAFIPVAALDRHRVMEGVGVGEYYHTDIEDIVRAIRRAADRNEVLTIFSHAIVPDAKGVNMKTSWLVRILQTAKACGVDVRSFDELGKVSPQTPSEPLLVALTFDDGQKSHLTIAAEELEKRGWRGLFSIVVDWVGGEKKLTWDDVRELDRRGHEIAVHGFTHKSMGTLARKGLVDELRHEIVDARDALAREIGKTPRILCLPGTNGDKAVTEMAKANGLETMLIPRHGYGEWKKDVSRDVAHCRAVGVRRVDMLVHGITPETGGWKPFPSRMAFVKFLDDLRACEKRGEVKIVPYVQLLDR